MTLGELIEIAKKSNSPEELEIFIHTEDGDFSLEQATYNYTTEGTEDIIIRASVNLITKESV